MWEAWEGLGLGVVLQEDAVSLENHVRLAVDDQRALVRLEAHRVAELPAVGRHLGGSQQKRAVGNSGEEGRDGAVFPQFGMYFNALTDTTDQYNYRYDHR